jgi:rubrerythrin
MALKDLLFASWQRFFNTLQPDHRQRLIEILRDQYVDEAKDVVQFHGHARRMTYPHFRERLLRIAEEEKAHVTWLHDTIRALGGEVPQLTVTPKNGKNSWECLRMDVEEEKQDCTALLEQLNALDPEYPEIAEGLRRIREDEKRHREELLDLLLKSDPYALPVVTPEQEQWEREKQEWLEQQKREWFDKRRAEWEATGKPAPWAEWIAEREFEWAINELPNRELAWTRRLAGQGLAQILPQEKALPSISGRVAEFRYTGETLNGEVRHDSTNKRPVGCSADRSAPACHPHEFARAGDDDRDCPRPRTSHVTARVRGPGAERSRSLLPLDLYRRTVTAHRVLFTERRKIYGNEGNLPREDGNPAERVERQD